AMSSSNHKQMFEGVGAPVNVDQTNGHIDPTLDSCCQREIESNRKRTAVETALRSHDRVAHAENQRRHQPHHNPSLASLPVGGGGYNYNAYNLIHGMSFGSGCRCCYDPNGDGGEYDLLAEARLDRGHAAAAAAAANGNDNHYNVDHEDGNGANKHNNENNNSDDSDDEFDYLLDEDLPTTTTTNPGAVVSSIEYSYNEQRRAELENTLRHHEVARYHGYGVHRQMSPQRVFAAVGYGADQVRNVVCPRGAVLHLYDDDSPLSVSLDLCLEGMATRYLGTKFVRGVGIASLQFANEDYYDGGNNNAWRKKDNLPMVLALREGRVVAWSSGLRDFYRDRGSHEVESRAVEQWLEHAGVLLSNVPPLDTLCRIRPEEEMLLQNMRKLNNGLGSGGGGGGGGKNSGFGGMMGYMNEGKGTEDDLEDDQQQQQQRYDCGISSCNKCFYHEHVGVNNDAQDGLLVSESEVVASSS
ncbi:hypothetical protein ACHAXR_008297, partial [Thalassiosira sp. AJA248-18]